MSFENATPDQKELVWAYETHDVEGIRALLDGGVSATEPIGGVSPVMWLLEMYMRSDRFPECLALVLERGGELHDPVLLPVLMNDAEGVRAAASADPSFIEHRTRGIRSTFTPLEGGTLLHVAAEYGNLEAARALIECGADVNARAATDASGLDGHTPIFHTVNAWQNRSLPVARLLLDHGAEPELRLPGIVWGRGYEWETTCFDVTPMSYAQMGLLPQMHRTEADTYETIRVLLEAAGRVVPPLPNVPNAYVEASKKKG